MQMKNRHDRLLKIYGLYDSFCSEMQLFCRKGCSLCCTTNVTLTSLEAELILAYLQEHARSLPESLLAAATGDTRFRPTITINHLAELCASGADFPDEAADPYAGACPLLEGGLCAIYAVRPFGCRAMQSLCDCRREGVADMPDWVLSANTLFLQYIEAADADGITGNLIDVLMMGAERLPARNKMPANRAIAVLMLPPEHRARLQGLVQSLRQISTTT
jgi:Fe-S-cluster containining protein